MSPLRAVVGCLLAGAAIAGCASPTPAPAARPRPNPGEPVVLPGGANVFVPTGPEDESVAKARVVAVDFRGKITIESERGPTEVWVSDPTRYHYGDPVEIRMVLRAGEVERNPNPAAPPTPLRLPLDEAGDHAVVVGPILRVDPRGPLTVDSERGPIRVWATRAPDRYRVGDFVEVRTRVRPAG